MSRDTKSNLQIVLLGTLMLAGCCLAPVFRPDRFEFSKPQMGAPFRIVLYAPDAARAEAAARSAFQRVEALNQIFSDYETDSELNALSRSAGSGKAVPISDDLWRILVQAQRFSELSDGAFDVTVGPSVNLWRKARRKKKLPDPTWLNEALQAVGYKKLELTNRTARLLVPNMKLDLGGIAKGYAVDEAMKVLKKHGIRSALVGAAGDIAVSDAPPGKTGWQIEIGSVPKISSLSNAAVSTSGDVFQHLDIDSVRYSHIVDPHTGVGLTNQMMVSVIAPDSTTADALATAFSVLGPQKSKAMAQHFPGVTLHFGLQSSAESR